MNWYADVGEWPMLRNDSIGDCVPAGILHHIQQRLIYAGKVPFLDDKPILPFGENDAITLYKRWNPLFNPNNPRTDVGVVMSQAMADWVAHGIALADGYDKPEAYVTVNYKDSSSLMLAIHQCGGVLIGFECLEQWLQTDYLMDLPEKGPGVVAGGHCMLLVGYEPTALGREFDAITWGGRFRITQRALDKTMDEAYCILSKDWCSVEGVDPAGIDWAGAEAGNA